MLAHQETGLLWLWGRQGSHRLLALRAGVMLNKQTPLYDPPPPKARELRGCTKCISLGCHGYLCEMPLEGSRLKYAAFPLLRSSRLPVFRGLPSLEVWRWQ